MAEQGGEMPASMSGNIPEGKEHHPKWTERYKGWTPFHEEKYIVV
jgi:uncharacterized phosphosugar-binding protein